MRHSMLVEGSRDMALAIRDEVIEELLQGYRSPEDLLGEEGLFKELEKGAELTEHLGYQKGEAPSICWTPLLSSGRKIGVSNRDVASSSLRIGMAPASVQTVRRVAGVPRLVRNAGFPPRGVCGPALARRPVSNSVVHVAISSAVAKSGSRFATRFSVY